jgi:hypothetical protein
MSLVGSLQRQGADWHLGERKMTLKEKGPPTQKDDLTFDLLAKVFLLPKLLHPVAYLRATPASSA